MDFVWEIDDDQPTKECESDGDKSFYNEDPTPSAVTTGTIELINSICEQISETSGEKVDAVEDGDAFLDLVAFIPTRNEK